MHCDLGFKYRNFSRLVVSSTEFGQVTVKFRPSHLPWWRLLLYPTFYTPLPWQSRISSHNLASRARAIVCSDNDILSLLSNVGGSLLFKCDYDIPFLPLYENLPKFCRDIISHWQVINNTSPKKKGDVLNQIICNNQFIRVNKSSVFFPGWKKVGIENLSCVCDNESNTLMTFTTFMRKYNLKGNFLQYYSLLSAIPKEWKTMLKQECLLPSTECIPLAIEKRTCKSIYNTLLNHQHLPPPKNVLQRENSLKMTLSFKKDKKLTHFLFVLQLK